MIQASVDSQTPHFGVDLSRWMQIFAANFVAVVFVVVVVFFCFFFCKYLASSVTRYHGQLSWFTIQKKKMIQSSENLVAGKLTDRETDRKTDESDFID